MKLSDFIPSADLLEKLEGLEDGLKRRRRLGRLGKFGAVFAFLTWLSNVAPLLPNWLQNWLSSLPGAWKGLVIIGLVATLGLVFLAVLYSLWLRESRRPIRYTCSIGHFSPVSSEDQKPVSLVVEKMNWLRHDLAQSLNQRVGRLMFFLSPDGRPPAQPAEKEAESGPKRHTDQHIHIEGVYYAQNKKASQDAADAWELVVMPRVRIGRADSPDKLAEPVLFRAPKYPELSVDQYKELIEQVYFNLVTEVYQQIRQDVERKITLLPTRRHKAVAYYYEAEDYARSNTLRAYEEAYQLYREASRYFEPFNPLVNPFPKSRLLRMWRALDRAVDTQAKNLFRLLYHVRPAMALHEILAARAKLGCANMLLFRSQLSQLLGHRPVPMYEARRFAEQALHFVKRLPDDAHGRKRSLFDGHVTNALSWSMLGEYAEARDHLQRAKSIDPHRATTSAVYLFAESLAPAEPQQRYEMLVCAVEQDPTFEIARFSKAFQREMRWRRSPSPTSAQLEAGLVVDEYRDVLKLNPSNIGAAANAAFVLWALVEEDESRRSKNIKEAKEFLERALRYKELAPETVVVEHHYGFARIYAEEGDFEKAYEHLVKAEDGRRAHRSTHNVDPTSYFYAFVTDDLRRRYKTYRDAVLKRASHAASDKGKPFGCDTVCAFVLDEYGQACWSNYLSVKRDARLAKLARNEFLKSIKSDKTYVLSHYHLASLSPAPEAIDSLKEVVVLDSSWQWAVLGLAVRRADRCTEMLDDAAELEQHAADLESHVESPAAPQAIDSFRRPDEVVKDQSAPTSDAQQGAEYGKSQFLEELRLKRIESRIIDLLTKYGDGELPRPEIDRRSLVNRAKTEVPRLRKQVGNLKADVQKAARKLLPHHWLWLSAGHGESDFNVQCLKDLRYKMEAKCEREFDAIQVGALYEWTRMLFLPVHETSSLGRNLLSHIRETFAPGDLAVMSSCQLTAQGIESDELIRQGGRLVDALLPGPCDRNFLEWFEGLQLKLPDNVLEKLSEKAKQCGAVLRSALRPLALKAMKEAEQQYKEFERAKAAQSYTRVLDLDAGGPETRLAAGRLATLLLTDNKLEEAESLIEQSLPETYTLLPSAVKEPDGDVEQFLGQNELARIEMKLCYERRLRTGTDRFATDAVMGLLRVPSGEENRSTEYKNVRTPLAVVWDETLLPSDVEDFLINQAARPLRQRLGERYGVLIPGIRFRPLEEAARLGLYRILDHDVVVEEGIATGRVPPSAPDIEENWKNPLWFTMDRLEIYLERNLSQWIRAQEVQNLLERHCPDRYHPTIPNSIVEIETHKHIGPLTIVIRSLVAERVSIRQFAKIYELYRSLWDAGEHVQAMTREIRKDRAIRPELWGNTQEYRRFVLSESAEAELWDACESIDGFTALVLHPRRREEIVRAIMAGMKAEGKKSLTIRQSILRPLVRRLIEPELPDVPVLAEEEVECHVRAIECIEIPIPPTKKSKG